MSIDLNVYLRRASMPSPAAWKQAIREAGFPVDLDDDFDPDSFSGFLPCKLRDMVSGFEYFSGQLSEADCLAVARVGSDFSVTFVTHSDLREFACSAAASSVLALASGGMLIDPQSGESFALGKRGGLGIRAVCGGRAAGVRGAEPLHLARIRILNWPLRGIVEIRSEII